MLAQQYHFPRLDPLGSNGSESVGHSNRHARLSHQMPEAAAEASARFLIRTVPLIYGGLLGWLADSLVAGLTVGLAMSLVLDVQMRGQSLARPWLGALRSRCCPDLAIASLIRPGRQA